MQQIATNQFIKNANNFGNSYEKQIANAFEEIQQNEQEIKESINALYKGPESFVEQAQQDLSIIEERFKHSVEDSTERLTTFRNRLFKVCGIVFISAFCILLALCLLLYLGTGFLTWLIENAKVEGGWITWIVWFISIIATIGITYKVCKSKGV